MTAYAPFFAAWLFLLGLFGVVTSRHWVHLILCLTVTQSGTYVLLLAVAARPDATDPLIHALMMVDVVGEAAIAGLLLALAVLAHQRSGKSDPRHPGNVRG